MGIKFDAQRMAELTAQESKKREEVEEMRLKLNDSYEESQNGNWDSQKGELYIVNQQRYSQLQNELRMIREDKASYELLEPEGAKIGCNSPLGRFLADGPEGLEEDERKSFLASKEDQNAMPIMGPGSAFVIKNATRSDDDTGQEAVQEEIPPRVIDRLAFYGGVSRMAQQYMTGTGGDYRLMQMDESTTEGAILDDQNSDLGGDDLAKIGVVTFGAKTATSKRIVITREMLQDSVFDIQTYAERQALRRMGRSWNRAFTLGNGNNGTPLGVVTIAKEGIETKVNNAFTWEETTDLIYAIDRAYREELDMGENGEGGFNPEMGGVVGYMISDSMENALRRTKDTDGRPLWVPSIREGLPDRYNGWPYVVNGHMAEFAAGTIPMLFGNFSYYGIRTVRQVEIFRFLDSRTMVNNAVECVALSRRDGRAMGALTGNNNTPPCEAIAKLTVKT